MIGGLGLPSGKDARAADYPAASLPLGRSGLERPNIQRKDAKARSPVRIANGELLMGTLRLRAFALAVWVRRRESASFNSAVLACAAPALSPLRQREPVSFLVPDAGALSGLRTHRGGVFRMHHAPLRRHDAHRPHAPFVVKIRQGWIEKEKAAGDRPTVGGGQGIVDEPFALLVAAGKIQGHLIAFDGDCAAHCHRYVKLGAVVVGGGLAGSEAAFQLAARVP